MGKIDERGEPVGVDEARVASDKKGPVVGVVDFNIAPVDLDGFWGNYIFDVGGSAR